MQKSTYICVFLFTIALLNVPAFGECNYNDYRDWMDKGKDFEDKWALDLAVSCFDKAIESISDCIGAKEERADAYGWKGWILFESGEYDNAIAAYDKALANKKVDWIWLSKGRALFSLNRYAEAVSAYDEAIALNPVDKRFWYHKGIALGEMDRYAEAIDALDNALSIDSTYKDVWLRKGIIYERWGKNQSALDAYDMENEISPSSTALMSKADLQIKMGQYDGALESVEKCIEQNPNSTAFWRKKGDIFSMQSKYNQAIEAFNESIKINKNDSLAWYKKGNDLHNLTLYKEAVESYDKVIEISRMYIIILDAQEDAEVVKSAKEGWTMQIETALEAKNKTLAMLGMNPPVNATI